MSVAAADNREQLLKQYGRWYGQERFAIAFTASTHGDQAKRVLDNGWNHTRPLTNPDYAAGLIATHGLTRNPAIVLRPSNLVVLECDTEDDLLRIESLGLPVTLTVRSSEPYKRHFYFRPPETLPSLPYVAFRFESGKLTADEGRYFLAPPSIHPSGAIYAFLPGRGPDDVDIAELPETVYRQLAAHARQETSDQRERIATDPNAKVQAGQRGDSIFRFACMLRRWGLPDQSILEAAREWNQQRCNPPIDDTRVVMQVDGAMKKQGGQELERARRNPLPDPDEDPGPEHEQQPGEQTDSWEPINLADPLYSVAPDPPAVAGLLYKSRRHVISGPPESTKTLIAYRLLLEAMRAHHTVAVIDFEMGPTAARRLLEDLGATTEELTAILYLEPITAPTDGIDRLIARAPTFVLIDAAIGAYDTSGLDDNARQDAERFGRTWIRPLYQAGIATIVIDHVVKNTESRGKFTIGSERKTGQADIHLSLEALKPLSRGHTGLVKVHVHKDRPGFLERPHAAMVELTSDPHTHSITWSIRAALPQDETTGEKRHTIYMERVSRVLEKNQGPMTRNEIESTPDIGKREYVRKGLDELLQDGYTTEEHGARNSRIVTLQKPYIRPPDDLAPTSPPPRPGEVPVSSHDLAPPPPPLTGERGEVDGHGKAKPDNDLAPTPIDVHDPAIQALLNDDIPF